MRLPVEYREPVVVQKTPGGAWDEQIDWAVPFRNLGSDTITASEWAVTGDDDTLTLYDAEIGDPATTTKIWMCGGTCSSFYTITNTITTSLARTLVDSFIVEVVPNIYATQPRCI